MYLNYMHMLADLEALTISKKIRTSSVDSSDGGAGSLGTANQKTKEALEEELNDERLCPICFNREKDTQYVPCQHISCKVCIQTHMLNK